MPILETLEARSVALQTQLQALLVDGQVAPEKREEWHGLMGAINELDKTISDAKDAEIKELRSKLESGSKHEEAAETTYEKEYRAFMRSGTVGNEMEKRASLSAGADANGGYLVPENLHAPLVDKLRKLDPVLGLATIFILTGGSPSIELPRKATHGAVANATETGARSEQNAPTIGNNTLTCYDYYTDQRATQLYLDSVGNSESQLLDWIYEDIMEQAGADAVSGDGSEKLKGLFAETALFSAQLSGTAGTLAAADLVNLYFKLKARHRISGKFLMGTGALKAAAQLADPAAADKPLLERVDGKWKLYGKEILETESAPAVAADAYPVAFGDISKAYAFGIHRQISILRDPYTATPKVRFYGLGRLGGRGWDPEACVLLKSGTV